MESQVILWWNYLSLTLSESILFVKLFYENKGAAANIVRQFHYRYNMDKRSFISEFFRKLLVLYGKTYYFEFWWVVDANQFFRMSLNMLPLL